MEEKERYELFGERCIKDNNPDARCQLLNTYQVYVILNEQDKEIIKLRQENQQLKQQLALTEKALKLAREYMFNVMCADDVPFESWFIECAKNDWKPS